MLNFPQRQGAGENATSPGYGAMGTAATALGPTDGLQAPVGAVGCEGEQPHHKQRHEKEH